MQIMYLTPNGFYCCHPCLVVLGDDSCPRGRGFESQWHILDGNFLTLICCKNGIVCLKETKNKRERGLGWPIFLKNDTVFVYGVDSFKGIDREGKSTMEIDDEFVNDFC